MRYHLPSLTILALLALLLAPAAALGQSPDNFRVSLSLGLGGTLNDDPDAGLDNLGWQAGFAMKLDGNTQWGARLGQTGLDAPGGLFDGDLTYLNLTGEYLFPAGYYESGIFLGLGLYDFSGDVLEDETALGAVVGVSGAFRLNDRFDILVEFSAHYADLDYTQFFAFGHVGLAYRF